jgi:small subunit ribosomal protein S17
MPNRDIGIDVRAPSREPAPGDKLNPFNGSLSVRGSVIVGTVVTSRMQGTCVVEKQHQRLVEKFERYEKRTRRYPAHVPSNIDVHVGDEVVIAECRPISKTVNFVVVENRGNPAATRGAVREAREARTEAATARPERVSKVRTPKKPAETKPVKAEAAKAEPAKAEKPKAPKAAKKEA